MIISNCVSSTGKAWHAALGSLAPSDCSTCPTGGRVAHPRSPGTHRFLEVPAGLLSVARVVVEDGAELEVGAGLDAGRGLAGQHGLQAVDAQAHFGRARRAEVLGQAQQRHVPRL